MQEFNITWHKCSLSLEKGLCGYDQDYTSSLNVIKQLFWSITSSFDAEI